MGNYIGRFIRYEGVEGFVLDQYKDDYLKLRLIPIEAMDKDGTVDINLLLDTIVPLDDNKLIIEEREGEEC